LITVFYDGKCSLCKKEIAYYKKIAPVGNFIWSDITLDASPLTQRGISLKDGLMFFHVEDERGVMHSSLDAFIVVWQKLPGWLYLAKIASLPVLNSIMGRGYKIFAKYRFKKNGYCKIKFE
jgi:predicted DCC family thiol-disulfide oxidoreductase YuxK